MTKISAYTLALACCVGTNLAIAQEIAGISAERAEISNGQAAELSIDVRTSQSQNTDNPVSTSWRCGLLVNYGDGKSEFHRVDSKQVPHKVTHKYDAPGNYAVTFEGKGQLQSLTLPCLGKNRSIAVIVRQDNFAEREAAERAAKEDALKRAAADRQAAERAADKAKKDRVSAERASQKAAADRANAAKGATGEPKPALKLEEKSAATETKPAPTPTKARSPMDL